MSAIQFVCDEDTRAALAACLLRVEPSIEILAIGQPDAPPKGTKDPELLLWAEEERYSVISRDRRTMVSHVANHLAAGHHTLGVFMLRQQFSWQRIADELLLIWSASQAEEWQDRIEIIPW